MENQSMMTPGFSAETSLYRSSLTYYARGVFAGSEHQSVRAAQDSCTCTSPNCTWSCPPPPPPDPCAGLSGCALRRCICSHEPGCKIVSDFPPAMLFPLLLLITLRRYVRANLEQLRQHIRSVLPTNLNLKLEV